MAHELPELPYAYDALEPYLDEQTMRLHHCKHHAAYVENLNRAIAGTQFETVPVPQLLGNLYRLPSDIRAAVRNHGGGHVNHSLFWKAMGPGASDLTKGALADVIDTSFGSFDGLKKSFQNAALNRFGSGWVWLVVRIDGSLVVYHTPDQDGPFSQTGEVPLLGLDVWEHAYYLKYQNRRAEYVDNWWNVVNWEVVAERYEANS